MFDVRLGEKALKRIFDSLDSARRGVVEWRTVLEYITPLAHGDVVVCECANVVTCMAISSDCSVVAFAGTGFVRATSVATKVPRYQGRVNADEAKRHDAPQLES
jgi:hypothetical protein